MKVKLCLLFSLPGVYRRHVWAVCTCTHNNTVWFTCTVCFTLCVHHSHSLTLRYLLPQQGGPIKTGSITYFHAHVIESLLSAYIDMKPRCVQQQCLNIKTTEKHLTRFDTCVLCWTEAFFNHTTVRSFSRSTNMQMFMGSYILLVWWGLSTSLPLNLSVTSPVLFFLSL